MTAVERITRAGRNRAARPITDLSHMPGDFYTSPEVFALEKQHIFMHDWLCVARTEELARPGDYMTLRICGEPVVIARDAAGAIHAFANVCAHRGVEVASGAGNAKEFSCPYHGWLYGLDGRLLGAPYMKEAAGFDPKACRLPPIRHAEWAKWIFITFNDDAEPLLTWLEDFIADFGFLKQDRCRLAGKIVTELDCNWKFAVENVMDYYHVGVLHSGTFGSHISITDVPFTLRKNGGFSAFYPAAPMVEGSKAHLPKMPWMDGYDETFACGGYVAPNLSFFARIDDITPFVTWPIDADRSQLIIYLLFPEEFFALPNFLDIVAKYRSFMVAIVEEDRSMVQSLQRNMHTATFKPGRMSVLERPINHLVAHNLRRIMLGAPGAA